MRKIWLPLLLILAGILTYRMLPQTPDLTVVGTVDIKDSLGRQAAELVDTFRNELKVNFIPTSKVKTHHLPQHLKKILKKSKKPKWGKVLIYEDMIWSPDRSPNLNFGEGKKGTIRIAYSMWESTKIPDEWVYLINKHFDAVCVPSAFLIEVYKNSGVTKPIFKLPLGLNYQQLAQLPLKKTKNTPMVFGNFSAFSDRKNQVALVKAFHKAFGNRTDVLLKINGRYGEVETIAEITKYISQHELENVQLTRFSLSPSDYLREMQSLDCYVSPSKGEGFSIQPREAMMLGIPVIATDNTGQKEICASGLVLVIESNRKEPALFPWGGYYGKNFHCEVDDLATALLTVANDYETYLERGQEAREWAQQFTYESLAPLYFSIIHPLEIILCDEDQIFPGGIKTSSEPLYQKYQRAFH